MFDWNGKSGKYSIGSTISYSQCCHTHSLIFARPSTTSAVIEIIMARPLKMLNCLIFFHVTKMHRLQKCMWRVQQISLIFFKENISSDFLKTKKQTIIWEVLHHNCQSIDTKSYRICFYCLISFQRCLTFSWQQAMHNLPISLFTQISNISWISRFLQ